MSTGVQRLVGTTFGTLNIVQNELFIVSTTGAATATLPAGYEGQKIYILLSARVGDLTVTGDFETGTTATFNAALDALQLMYVSNHGWMTVSNQGVVVFA